MSESAKFCEVCGVAISNTTNEDITQNGLHTASNTTPKLNNQKKPIVVGVALFVIVVAVVTAFFAVNKGFDKSQVEEKNSSNAGVAKITEGGKSTPIVETGDFFVFAPQNSVVTIDGKELPFSTIGSTDMDLCIFFDEAVSVGKHTLIVSHKDCKTYTTTINVEKINMQVPKTMDDCDELLGTVIEDFENGKAYGEINESFSAEEYMICNCGASNVYFVSLDYTDEYLSEIENKAYQAFKKITDGFNGEIDLSSIDFASEEIEYSVIDDIKDYAEEGMVVRNIKMISAKDYWLKNHDYADIDEEELELERICRRFMNNTYSIVWYVYFDFESDEDYINDEDETRGLIGLVNVDEKCLVYEFQCYPIPGSWR